MPDVTTDGWAGMSKRDILRYTTETNAYWARIDDPSESVCVAVVAAVAAVSGTAPLELPPLYSDIGADGVEELSEMEVDTPPVGDASISVMFAGHDVTVYADGAISVRPPSGEL